MLPFTALLGVLAWVIRRSRSRSRCEAGMWLSQLAGLPVRESATGRSLGTVRRVLFDPAHGTVAGIETGRLWWKRVAPWSAVAGVWSKGLLFDDACTLVRREQAPDLAALARGSTTPLGAGSDRRRVVTRSGTMLGTVRADRLWLEAATGQVWLELLPKRFSTAWGLTLTVLDRGPLEWARGWLQERGLEVLPQGLPVCARIPAGMIRALDQEIVFVADEAQEIVDAHCRRLEEAARQRLARARDDVHRTCLALDRARALRAKLAPRPLHAALPRLGKPDAADPAEGSPARAGKRSPGSESSSGRHG